MLRTAGLLIAVVTPVSAATMGMYIPGGAPCAGACTQEWAETAFHVPSGEPQPMTVPAGSYVRLMSYGKDGKPYWQDKPMIFAQDEPAIGYELPDGRWMVRLWACMNWAVVTLPGGAAEAPVRPSNGASLQNYGFTTSNGGYFPTGTASGNSFSDMVTTAGYVTTTSNSSQREEGGGSKQSTGTFTQRSRIPDVPLPASGLLMLVGLLIAALHKTTRSWTLLSRAVAKRTGIADSCAERASPSA